MDADYRGACRWRGLATGRGSTHYSGMARPTSRDWKAILEAARRDGMSATQVAEQEACGLRTVGQAATRLGIILRDGRTTNGGWNAAPSLHASHCQD